jgi:hypothetical protein
MSTEGNKRIVKEFFERLVAFDRDALLDLIVDDMIWTVIGTTPASGTLRGKAEIVAYFDDVFTRIDPAAGLGFTFLDYIAEGDKVACLAEGTMVAKYGQYNNTYAYVFTVKNDKIVEIYEYVDTDLINRALYGKQAV